MSAAPQTAQQTTSAGAGLLLRSILAQTRVELLLTIRRGESVLITIIVPVVLLVFFASLNIVPSGTRAIDFLLPGMLALAVMATGMVSLGIATARERRPTQALEHAIVALVGGGDAQAPGWVAAPA